MTNIYKTLKFNSAMNKRGISPVITSALFLVVAVVAVISFQTWFNNYSSITLSNVETRSSNNVGSTSIETIVDTTLYFKNGENNNLTINSVKVGGYDCNVSATITPGINSLDLSACIYNLTKGSNEVTIYTNKGIYNERLYLQNIPLLVEPTTLSFSSNVTSIVTGSSINLTWDAPLATSCIASGSWSGSKSTSGSVIISSITTNSNYYLNCSNSKNLVSKNISINVYNDPYWPLVALLINGNSAVDETGKTITANGAATIASVGGRTGLRVGQSTGYIDYYSIPASNDFIFTSDFTIEFWIYGIYRAGNYPTPIALRTSSVTQGHWAMHLNPHIEANIDASIYASGYGWITPSQPAIFIDSSWHHLAITKQGTTVRMFKDGVLVGTSTAAYTVGNSAAPLTIGGVSDASACNCYIDDLRFTNGVARYTSAFTPPSNNLPVN